MVGPMLAMVYDATSGSKDGEDGEEHLGNLDCLALADNANLGAVLKDLASKMSTMEL